MVVYLSGAITSCLDTYKEKFSEAQRFLEDKKHIVINPAILPRGLETEKYLPICLSMLDACEAVFLIDGWENSKGARIEKAYAEYQGKLVIYDTRIKH